jgi:hypothetical protein
MSERGGYPGGTGGHVGVRLDTIIQEDPGEPQDKEDDEGVRLCARSWLARHPATIEITRSSGGSSPHPKIFFFFAKIMIFLDF